MLFDIPNQPVKFLSRMIARAFIMDIAKGTLNRVGLRTITWQPKDLHPRVFFQPREDCLGFVDFVIVCDDINLFDLSTLTLLQKREQLSEENVVFPGANHVVEFARPPVKRPGSVWLLILTG